MKSACPAGRVDLPDDLGAALMAASADDDVRPFRRERRRDRAADVAGSSVTSAVLSSSRLLILGVPFVAVVSES